MMVRATSAQARGARAARSAIRALGLAPPLVLAVAFVLGLPAGAVAAEPAPSWRLEQPPVPGVAASAPLAGLGAIGDIEFWAPNRGLLITSGDPPTIPPGVWAYDGTAWHELATVCGGVEATQEEGESGRIAWAGPEEFWTISSGRPGQSSQTGEVVEIPPLIDNTLCHFAGGAVVASYAHAEFQADSYQRMRAAACFSASDCWFGGYPLPEPQIGAFQLHWSGSALEAEPYPGEAHAVQDMQVLEGHLYESVRIKHGDPVSAGEEGPAPALHRINPEGVHPTFLAEPALPLYGEGELPEALDYLDLSAADGALWAAAGPKPAEAGSPGQLTVARRVKGAWTQLIGPEHPIGAILPQPSEEEAVLGNSRGAGEVRARQATVSAIAADPGTESAWIALAPREGALDQLRAVLIHVSATGEVLEEQTLPSAAEQREGIGPKGAAARLSCPARNDCWLATTEGWLFHLAPAGQRTLQRDEDPAFAGPITYRPPDQGLPQLPPDAPPPDTSGLVEQQIKYEQFEEKSQAAHEVEAVVSVPLLSQVHSRLVGSSTLQLSFQLAVKARVKLLAKRRGAIVAATPTRTLKAGRHTLSLRLDPRRWPTKLSLRTRALAPLPTVSSRNPNVGTISTAFAALPRVPLPGTIGSAR